MPADDVSDLRDVFEAINRLCDTMKTAPEPPEPEPEPRPELVVRSVEILTADDWDALSCETDSVATDEARDGERLTSAFVSAEDVSVRTDLPWRESRASPEEEVAAPQGERWSDPPTSDEVPSRRRRAGAWPDGPASPPDDTETVTSDTEAALPQGEPASDVYYTASSEVSLQSDSEDRAGRGDDKDGKCTLGHVAAMRERFESMTRGNTPCPASPTLDVFRNITPSPDRLG